MAEFSRTIFIEAFREADGQWLVTDEEGNTITMEHQEFIRTYSPVDGVLCEVCSNYINPDTDKHYLWAGNIYTCEICGGADEEHKPSSIFLSK